MNLVFESILIIDKINKIAKKVFFDKKNIVTSDINSQGKSVLLKSLFHSLGANSKFDAVFKKDYSNIYFCSSIKLDDKKFIFIRNNDSYLILDEFWNPVLKTNRDIKKVSNFFDNNAGMSVFLEDKYNNFGIVSPAYCFVPYYMDQDLSWKNEQFPFDNMKQFTSTELNKLYFYHLGLYTNEYVKKTIEESKLNKLIKELEEKRTSFLTTYSDIKNEYSSLTVLTDTYDVDALLNNVKSEFENLLDKQKKLSNQIVSLENENAELNFKLEMIKTGKSNLKEEGKQVTLIKCPKCGEELNVRFSESLSYISNLNFLSEQEKVSLLKIKENNEKITSLKQQLLLLNQSLSDLKNKYENENNKFEQYSKRISLESILSKISSKIKENDEDLIIQKNKLKAVEIYISSLAKNKNDYSSLFIDNYFNNLTELGVKSIDKTMLSAFKKVSVGGSQYVRSSLAFYLSFIEVKNQINKDSFNCPLIIDSPRDGEQDNHNSELIMDILSKKISNFSNQLILASVNAEDFISDSIKKDFKIIKINAENNKLLTSNDYQENINEINKILEFENL